MVYRGNWVGIIRHRESQKGSRGGGGEEAIEF